MIIFKLWCSLEELIPRWLKAVCVDLNLSWQLNCITECENDHSRFRLWKLSRRVWPKLCNFHSDVWNQCPKLQWLTANARRFWRNLTPYSIIMAFSRAGILSMYRFFLGNLLVKLDAIIKNDYVPNDIRPLSINLKVVSLNIKLSITTKPNEYDCAINSRKGIRSTSSIETNAFGTSTLPAPTPRRQLLVTQSEPSIWWSLMTLMAGFLKFWVQL